MRLKIYVFSFNRGVFLQNCMFSLEKCASYLPVTIIDDNSDDIKTVQVLKDLSDRYPIIRNDPNEMKEKKTGGLYGNMNLAMHEAKKDDYEYVLFIQDDMQMVRKIICEDWDIINNYFSSNTNSIELSTNFIRRLSEDNFLKKFYVDESDTAYIRKPEFQKGKSNFSATGIFHVDRFFKYFKKFEVGEGVNSKKAMNLNLVCGRAVYPFMNWLPYPISFRDKKRKFTHYFLEKIGGSGFHPIQYMDDKDVKKFFEREYDILPLMEKYLYSPTSPRHDIWSTAGGEYNILARSDLALRIKNKKEYINIKNKIKKYIINIII